jgi:hypothetical protein
MPPFHGGIKGSLPAGRNQAGREPLLALQSGRAIPGTDLKLKPLNGKRVHFKFSKAGNRGVPFFIIA